MLNCTGCPSNCYRTCPDQVYRLQVHPRKPQIFNLGDGATRSGRFTKRYQVDAKLAGDRHPDWTQLCDHEEAPYRLSRRTTASRREGRSLVHDKARWSLYIPPVKHSTVLRSAHTVYACALCGSQNNQRLFPYTALTDWFLSAFANCVKRQLASSRLSTWTIRFPLDRFL
jgi:hypothetical protein